MPNLRVGDTVEVKSLEEVLATLDSRGALEALPFMPEMIKYCGKRFKVYKRADKTGQYITRPRYSSRKMCRTVHLEGLRCDGEYHDGCDALCLLYWKEAWLRRVGRNISKQPSDREKVIAGIGGSKTSDKIGCTLDTLLFSTKIESNVLNPGKGKYYCQVTEVINASSELSRWDIRQYYRDLRFGNISFKDFAKWASLEILNCTSQKIRHKRIYPDLTNPFAQQGKTPSETVNLKVGDYVKIKSLEEIFMTLDVKEKNRGLLFTKELVPYCGKITKVIKIVKNIVNEENGEMICFPNRCIVLENVICTGEISDKRLFCPKSCYPYWREIWLRKL